MHRTVSLLVCRLRISIAVVAAALGAELSAPLGAQTPRAQDGEVVFVRPTRRAPEAPPVPPPELPSRAHAVEPLTFDVVTRRTPPTGPVLVERQRVSRTKDRIHLVTSRTEWLFERNPIDPRRVSALLVHHPSRSIVAHEESDLRNTLGINGWAAVLMLGLDPHALGALTPTAESRTRAGLPFRKHTAASDGTDLAEVWWNPEHLLPLTTLLRNATGLTHIAVHGLKRGVDATLLRAPAARFPEYRLIDLAEWLEGH